MNPLLQLRYYFNVHGMGRAVLSWDRKRLERRLRSSTLSNPSHQAKPLLASGRLKQLISRHYLKGRYANGVKKVAWVTSGAPVEFLVALGYFVLYPENHAAVCAIRRQSEEFCSHAEASGYSSNICSYARTDFGAILSGKTPVGKLPKPDLLLCCTNICQTVLFWYQVLAHVFKVPLILIDTPFVYQEVPDHALAYVKRQLEEGIFIAEKIARRSLKPQRLESVTRLSREASLLWMQILETGQQVPSPITAFDEFVHMGPIVEMRGLPETVDYYQTLLSELQQRIQKQIGAVVPEGKRLLWDNLPVWFMLRRLSEFLAERNVALVGSTYTNAWGELAHLIDPADPLTSAAQVYLRPIINQGTGHKLSIMKQMVSDYRADGVILHANRSCKPYSIGQMDQAKALASDLKVPAFLLEADHNDPRAFQAEAAFNRLEAFLEMLS